MTPAFGPQGVPGDAVKIKAACDNLYALFLALYEWELDVRFVRVHKAFECLFPQMSGWSGELLAEFQRIPHEFDRLLADTQLVGEHNIRLTILAPKSVPILMEIIQGMVNDPKVLMALRDD